MDDQTSGLLAELFAFPFLGNPSTHTIRRGIIKGVGIFLGKALLFGKDSVRVGIIPKEIDRRKDPTLLA